MLRIHCGKCNAAIETGTEMSWDDFRGATFTQRVVECPNCENLQTWTLDDVDRSVFKDAKQKP